MLSNDLTVRGVPERSAGVPRRAGTPHQRRPERDTGRYRMTLLLAAGPGRQDHAVRSRRSFIEPITDGLVNTLRKRHPILNPHVEQGHPLRGLEDMLILV